MTYETLVSTRYTTGSLRPWPRDIPFHTRLRACVGAFAELIWFDLYRAGGFRQIRRAVSNVPVAKQPATYDALTLVRVVVRDACVFYFKRVHCLQRSSAVTRMLRRRGVAAELVVGCQVTPVESHAWVELEGRVIWDGMTDLHRFSVIDRF